MLLLSSFLFVVNLLMKDIRYLLILSILLLLISYKKKKKIPLFVYFFYLTLSLSKIFFYQEGEVLIKVFGLYITKEAVLASSILYIKLFNILHLSKLISSKINIRKLKFAYSDIIEIIIEMVPEIFTLFKKRVRIRDMYTKILRKVYRKL